MFCAIRSSTRFVGGPQTSLGLLGSQGSIRTFLFIDEKTREKARLKLLQKYKDNEFDFNDDWNAGALPSPFVLDTLKKTGEYVDSLNWDAVEAQNTSDFYENLSARGLQHIIVNMDRVAKVTRGGKILRSRALVVVGNLKGAGGYGIGKGRTAPQAIERAITDAIKNVQTIDMYDERTLYHDVEGSFNSCKVLLRSAPKGKGYKISNVMGAACSVMGLQDVVGKILTGNRNPYTVVKATFDAFSNHESIEEIAMRTGQSIIDLNKLSRAKYSLKKMN